MATTLTAPPSAAAARVDRQGRRDRVSFARLLWVAPLTIVVALAVNYGIKLLVQTLDPSLQRMGQLQTPLVSLTGQGAIYAVLAFVAIVAVVPRPIFWYRIVATVALLLSLIPDIALGLGGAAAGFGMRVMQPFLSLGMPAPGPAAGGSPPAGGPPVGGMPAMSVEQVLVLILLHVACYAVCVTMLTTVSRRPAR